MADIRFGMTVVAAVLQFSPSLHPCDLSGGGAKGPGCSVGKVEDVTST